MAAAFLVEAFLVPALFGAAVSAITPSVEVSAATALSETAAPAPALFGAATFLVADSLVATFVVAGFLAAAFLVAVPETAFFGGAVLTASFFAAAFFTAAVFVAPAFVATCFVAPAFEAASFVPTVFPPAVFVPPTVFLASPCFAAPFAECSAPMDLPDADCCTAVFFATMAAAPSHIVILLANRAGTINRLESRGNGARRPIRRPRPYRVASLQALCPAPRRVIRRVGRPRMRTRPPRHSGQSALLPGAPPPLARGPGKTGRPLSARRRTLGGARSVDGDE